MTVSPHFLSLQRPAIDEPSEQQSAINAEMDQLVRGVQTHNLIALDMTIDIIRLVSPTKKDTYAATALRLSAIANRCVFAFSELKKSLPPEAP